MCLHFIMTTNYIRFYILIIFYFIIIYILSLQKDTNIFSGFSVLGRTSTGQTV